ncbi:putative bifunctional diguanylate cyclase/phosphodiesterase [Sulfurimonas sp.]|uniref:putative bifunctional diguanylate cyclase/phosphodiesterase n=1 Tax=Sulfurimonas sp. TaxID=2022749 RepID=UPI00356867C7
MQKYVAKAAVDRIYDNSKNGIIGHVAVLFLTSLLFWNKIPPYIIGLGVASHMFLILRRSYLRYKYFKIKESIIDLEEINSWMRKYRRCMFFSGLAFGLMIFFFQELFAEYHFLILTILIGLSAGGLYTLGEVFSIYASYALAMLLTALSWMLLQDAYVYTIGSILIVIAIYYYLSMAHRYSNNFEQIIIEQHSVLEYLHKQEEMQNELLDQKDILEHQATHDTLTGLPNRTLFNDRLEQSIQKAKRNGTNIALFFIDLDHFKEINDSLGHHIGDEVLKVVTSRLNLVIRLEDTLARLGGDEFTIIMEDINNVQYAILFSEKILKVLVEPISINSQKLYLSSSIGISLFPQDSTDANNLLKYADAAMYKAKAEGRNNFQFYSKEMTELAFERVIMVASLKQAIKKREFIVHYQPQIDATNDKLVGMEALVRWEHPTLGLVSPAKFIPLAEDTGLIVDIDALVMEMAMEQVSMWHSIGLDPGVLSLNLAMKQLNHDSFIIVLKHEMSKYDFKSEWLELEITENDVMKRPKEAVVKLKEVSELGIKIAIDDFGTGYSSLSYLKRLPIDKLKIDQSFIRDIPGSEDDNAIVKAVIAISKSLNLDVIAEGVEIKEQKDFLLENGCNKIQGYYYSKPLPADEMQRKLKKFTL